MSRFCLSIIFCIYFQVCFSQDKLSGTAKYIVKEVTNEETIQSTDFVKSLEPFAKKIAADFSFELIFNSKGSAFFLRDDTKLKQYSKKSLSLSAIKYEYADTIWQDATYSYSITSMPGRSDKFFMYSVKNKPEWKITKEKKDINGYTCYKATKVIVNRRGKKTFSTPVIAWFCPEFPIGYGPLEYGNLPGLIFELQTQTYLYGISSISLVDKIDVPKKPDLEKYTEEELIQSLNKSLGK